MVIRCEQVWQEVSNLLEGDVSPDLRAAIEEHVRGCSHCRAVLNGTRNVVRLYGDDRVLEIPPGFSARWQARLAVQTAPPRGTNYGWLVAVAATAIVSASYAVAKFASPPAVALKSEHAYTRADLPSTMTVAVSAEGKIFHLPGCRFIHEKPGEKLRLIAVSEAVREGYIPCTRCLRERILSSAIRRDR
ncbi:MAG TPA: zf-HC2 domain-containing protein [Terriglobales bacterium]|jgi:hypothetical protein